MENPQEFIEAGFEEYLDSDVICIVEWPEKAGEILPKPDIAGIFLIIGTGRRITLEGLTVFGAAVIGTICVEPHD
jgi:tRNA threonylcarbamoyladenosine biosynthesis protein TsaE